MSSLQKRLIFKKYKVGKSIDKTHISSIYKGINIITKEQVAMKFEKIGGKYDFLGAEISFLLLLKGIGIPDVISYGNVMNYKVLIEELLGKSIYQIWNDLYIKNRLNNNKYLLNDICLMAIQCLDRLEYVHSKNIVHKDIKPGNFLFGRKNPNLIYLIDFGMSRKYRSSKTGKHIKLQKLNKINGSLIYMSINSSNCYESSRRDDLESLGYMIIFLMKNDLPWIDIENENINQKLKFEKVYAKKLSITPEILCQGLPYEFSKYIDYCRKLEFEQEPDYNYLRNLFIDVLKGLEKMDGSNHLNCKTFFFNKKDSNQLKEKILSSNRFSSRDKTINKGRNNAHKRIYGHLKSSIEKNNKRDLSNISSAVHLNSELKKISVNQSKNNDDNNDKNKMNYNTITISNDNKIINNIDINILYTDNNNNKKEATDKKIIESKKDQINNLIQNCSKLNQKICNKKVSLNIAKKPLKIGSIPIPNKDIKYHKKTEDNFNLIENYTSKKPISKQLTNLTCKSKINHKLNTPQNHIGKKISQSFNVGSKQNIVLFHNKNQINDLGFNNKEKDKYHLNENIHYKSIIENERKEEKLNNQHYEYGSLLNNNFKNGSKFLIRNNLCINSNNSTNRHDSTSINKSNNIFGEINQLYPPRTFTNY